MICQSFQRASYCAWHLLESAASAGVQLGEETETDLLILHLKHSLQGLGVINGFNKRAESRNGADWEIWLVSAGNKSLGLRVQSKILSQKSGRYEHLHYIQRSSNTPQVTRLEAASLAVGAVPIYCLYTYWRAKPVNLANVPGCGHTSHSQPIHG